MKIVGFNGFKESGKDTTADAFARLCWSYGIFVERRGFADKMKIAGMRCFFGDAFADRELIAMANVMKFHGSATVSIGDGRSHVVDGRTFWQYLGTEAMRGTYGENFHIDALLPLSGVIVQDTGRQWSGHDALIANFSTPNYPTPAVAAITDVRFPNEAERILELGGEVWEIVRPGLEAGEHASEHPLPEDLVTVAIHNNVDSREEYVNEIVPPYVEDWIDRVGLVRGDRLKFRLPDR